MAEIPAIRGRIRRHLVLLQRRVDAIRDEVRRTRVLERLRPRMEALRALDERLSEQLRVAEERCPRPT